MRCENFVNAACLLFFDMRRTTLPESRWWCWWYWWHEEQAVKILVIEDNRDIAANIADYLEPRGHVLDFAATGTHGLQLALHAPVLPKAQGTEILERKGPRQ